jgi:hypothetical protein
MAASRVARNAPAVASERVVGGKDFWAKSNGLHRIKALNRTKTPMVWNLPFINTVEAVLKSANSLETLLQQYRSWAEFCEKDF